ncbi:MAG: LysR substrate-binding domain-containing protein [Paracoccaceae bacterium]|uniref:LysR substrate-binding domain-containing protein n=1 Tax=Parasphingorhabdus sp. TaxID=2709688 RepID=UPI003297C528
MRLSHLNALRALDATLRHGSFSEAAVELAITPAAVGQRVRSLEQYLGRDLFIRSSTGIEPTSEAQSVADQLTQGFSKVAGALETLTPKKRDGALRVTLPESFSENWLAPSLSDFHLQNPEVELHLDASNRDMDLMTDEFDLAIRYGPTSGEQFEERVLFGDYVLPVCSPEFANRFKLVPQRRSLDGVPLVHITHRTKDPGWVGFQAWGEAFNFDPSHLTQGIRFSRTGSGLQAAIAGQGLVLCGVVEASNALRSGSLILPFGPQLKFQTRYKYRLIWTRSRAMSAALNKFVTWMVERSTEFRDELSALLR